MNKDFFSGSDTKAKTITKRQAIDTGMAVVLILLILGFFTKNILFYKIAIPLLVINMTFPMFYYPFAIVWFGFSHMIGRVVSKIILTIIYISFVIPVGLLRQLLGKDSLRLSEFKKDKNSVMLERNYVFSSKDIEKPY